jgi:hypothetical protein
MQIKHKCKSACLYIKRQLYALEKKLKIAIFQHLRVEKDAILNFISIFIIIIKIIK